VQAELLSSELCDQDGEGTAVNYREFIRNKQRLHKPLGFEIDKTKLNSMLFPWQADIVHWALKRGRAALFEECGLGKTLQQLAWAEQVYLRTKEPVIIHTPVGVRQQTKREADKFGIGCNVQVVNSGDEVVSGINIVNYEKLHLFNSLVFSGVVLDESSILKSFTGKTKVALSNAYKNTCYRLACTATPAPNDHMELGNHADFLGVMPSNEMLSRWFINDTMKAGGYRLRGHAASDFWRWVSSWAVCVAKPSDVGGDDSEFDLPKLDVIRHVVEPDETDSPPGFLFNTSGLSATNIHQAKRLSNNARADKTAEIIAANKRDSWLVWCETNYEADALLERIDGAVEIRGSESEAAKESKLNGFSNGEIRILVTKPKLSGFGMNWQHCHNVVFAGLSFSFEQFYQAIRRCWRFGQTHPVTAHLVLADTEFTLESTIARKETDHKLMQAGMADAMRDGMREELFGEIRRDIYEGTKEICLPKWIKTTCTQA
jgi:superfamily II DNA or RNA helicase